MFRFARVYRLATHQDVFVTMMVARPERFLALFLAFFLTVCALSMQTIERDTTLPDDVLFNDFLNSIWFSAVTVTTVGYGDYTPITNSGRILAVFMMLIGIGLIGTLSAALAKAIQTVGSTEDKVKQLKWDNKVRAEQYKRVLDISSLAYNPVINVIGKLFEPIEEDGKSKQEFIGKLKSGATDDVSSRVIAAELTLKRSFKLNLDIALKLCNAELWTGDTTLARNFQRVPQRKKDLAEEKHNEILHDRNAFCEPRVRLQLLLMSFGVERKLGTKFGEFVTKMSKIIFTTPLQYDIFLERVFTMVAHSSKLQEKSSKDKNVTLPNYQMSDPLDTKLFEVERLLAEKEYGLYKRVDFHLIIEEVTLLVLEYDRLLSAKWALENLQMKPDRVALLPEPEFSPKGAVLTIQKMMSEMPSEYKQETIQQFLQKRKKNNGIAKTRSIASIIRANRSKLMSSGESSGVQRALKFFGTSKIVPDATEEAPEFVSVEDDVLGDLPGESTQGISIQARPTITLEKVGDEFDNIFDQT